MTILLLPSCVCLVLACVCALPFLAVCLAMLALAAFSVVNLVPPPCDALCALPCAVRYALFALRYVVRFACLSSCASALPYEPCASATCAVVQLRIYSRCLAG